MRTKFNPGKCCTTVGVEAKVPHEEVMAALSRHLNCDWGNVCKEDAEQNNWSLEHDARILSSYKSSDDTVFWIITEADRSATTVLLPEEY